MAAEALTDAAANRPAPRIAVAAVLASSFMFLLLQWMRWLHAPPTTEPGGLFLRIGKNKQWHAPRFRRHRGARRRKTGARATAIRRSVPAGHRFAARRTPVRPIGLQRGRIPGFPDSEKK